MRRHATHHRDNSLRRLSLANRWLLAGSLTLTGVLTDVVAHAFPSSAHASSTATRGHGHSKHAAKHGSSTAGTPKPPAQAPESSESSESSPAQSSEAPVEPSPEATRESAPAPSEETAPAPEAAPEPAPEAAPEVESSAPVVSGGS